MTRRFVRLHLVLCAVLVAGASARAQTRPFDLLMASVQDIQDAVGAGTLTYERLIQLYLARIEAYDRQGPKLKAVLYVNPRAIDIARDLDRERRVSGLRSPLHGIPLAIKDNIDTMDMPTTGGSLVFDGSVPPRDATVIERLRRAGAIIFIKTNLDELAASSMGLSTIGGQTLNPYDLTRSPGGSSSGTAVAVSAGFAAAGLATETGISIRGPASNTGIVGVAPSKGLISRAGVIPISFTQDRVGVHARTVADAALVLQAMRGFDAEDLTTAESLGLIEAVPYAAPVGGDLRGGRVGVLRDLFRAGAEFAAANALVEAAVGRLGANGVEVRDQLSTGLDLASLMPTLRLNNFEMRPAFDAYLRRRGAGSPVATLADLIATGKSLKGGNLEVRLKEAMGVEILDFDAEYRRRLGTRATIRDALLAVMNREGVDALIYPAKGLGAPPLGTPDTGPRDNAISSVTGLPAIVLPAGTTADGLPIALELLGRPFAEPVLFRLAAAYERLRGARPLPASTPGLRSGK